MVKRKICTKRGRLLESSDAYTSLWSWCFSESYEAKNGEINIFRLKEHAKRLFESAKIINVPIEFSFDEVMSAQLGVISKSGLKDAYIRPLIYLTMRSLGLILRV